MDRTALNSTRTLRSRRAIAAIAALSAVVLLLLALATLRPPPSVVWADEGTFLAMAESLARDGDLAFGPEDRARLEAAGGGRASVILQRTDGGRISYSKPVVYALLAAPFYALAGPWGLVALNALATLAALLLGFLVLRRVESRSGAPAGTAALVVASFAGCAVWLPYVTWRMADSLQASLALAGAALILARWRGAAVGAERPGPAWLSRLDGWLDSRAAPFVGAVLLGLLVSMRVNNALLALAPPLAILLSRRDRLGATGAVRAGRAAVVVGLAVAASFGAVAALSWATTGAVNPYRAERTSFMEATGYPAGADSEAAAARFERNLARHHTGVDSVADAPEIGYSALYFLVGRHTGLLIYFPAALWLLGAALRRPDAVSWVLVGAFAGAVIFLVGWKPENYFGGETFLGNRYLLPAYAVLLIAPARLPRGRSLVALWLLSAGIWASAAWSVVTTHGIDPSSQSHANAGVFRLLPYESTAQTLDGRRDRYWSGAFVRFVDPFATVGREAFDLRSGDPAAELLVAHWEPPGVLRLRVWSESGGRLRVSDWRREQTWELPAGEPTDLTWRPSTPWRVHRFWFEQRPYWAHALRVAFEAPEGWRGREAEGLPRAPATVRVFFLGDPEVVTRAASREVLEVAVPDRPAAGSQSIVSLGVRNTSWRNWQRDDVTAITARWRLLDAAGDEVAASPRLPLPVATIGPRERVDLRLPVSWPTAPGRYTLEADLVIEHIAWFAAELGEPLVSVPVEVVPASSLDKSPPEAAP